MTKVAAVKVDSYDYDYQDVEKGVQEALELLGGLDKFISPGDKVLLKPNMVEGVDKGLSVTTHPEVVTNLQLIRNLITEPCFGKIMLIM